MKILLVEINIAEEVWNGLGVGYLYSLLSAAGHSVTLKNLHRGSNLNDFVSMVKSEDYSLVGFSASFYNSFNFALTVAVKLKKEGVKSHIVMGGHTPTSYYSEILRCFSEIDSIVLGEGERPLTELAEKFYEPEKWNEIAGLAFHREGEIITNEPGKLVEDLDSLPYPFREKYVERELATHLPVLNSTVTYAMRCRMMVTASRGCFGRCSFCSVYHFYNYNVRRGRSVKNVVGEMEELVKKYNAMVIAFNDDNFFDPRDREQRWFYDFADELEKRKLDIIFNFQCRPTDVDYDLFTRLKEVGLHYVFVGTESFIPRTLKLLRKGLGVETNFKALEILSRLDLDYQAGLIVFEPFTTFDEVKESFSIISSLYDKYNYPFPLWIDRLRIYYGTEIFKHLLQKDILEGEFPFYSYKILDSRVECLSEIVREATFDFTKDLTEKETMLAPQAGNLMFLSGIKYLAGVSRVKKGDFMYLPGERVRKLSIETSRLFLKLIGETIDLLEGTPSDKDIKDITLYFKEEYGKEDKRIVRIIKEELVTV